jgi:hypothetical protein
MSITTQMHDLQDYVARSTCVYRKGDVVKTEGAVTTIDAFPALPEGLDTAVDCHFVHVSFTEALAELSHREFYDLILSAKEGVFQLMNLSDWAKGPSYIAIGAWIGDQTVALQFMACVHAHGLGNIITPGRLGISGAMADQMAGSGYVMLTGLQEPAEVGS